MLTRVENIYYIVSMMNNIMDLQFENYRNRHYRNSNYDKNLYLCIQKLRLCSSFIIGRKK